MKISQEMIQGVSRCSMGRETGLLLSVTAPVALYQ